MAFGIVSRQNVKLFGMLALGLAFFSLMFIPLAQWTFVIDWVIQTPLITILGQTIFFLIAVVILTLVIIMIREMVS